MCISCLAFIFNRARFQVGAATASIRSLTCTATPQAGVSFLHWQNGVWKLLILILWFDTSASCNHVSVKDSMVNSHSSTSRISRLGLRLCTFKWANERRVGSLILMRNEWDCIDPEELIENEYGPGFSSMSPERCRISEQKYFRCMYDVLVTVDSLAWFDVEGDMLGTESIVETKGTDKDISNRMGRILRP